MARPTHAATMRSARRSIEALGTALGDRERVSVQCRRGHHIGAVYDTAAGLVLRTRTGPRSHGTRDFYSSPHGSADHGEYVDLLNAGVADLDDRVPGWCSCGAWTLSRREIREAVDDRTRTLRIDPEEPA